MKGLEFWRLCNRLSVVEAVLLFLGEDPSNYHGRNTPEGYEAVFKALTYDIMAGRLPAEIHIPTGYCYNNEEPPPDWDMSTVLVDDLRKWFASRGVKDGFFFPEAPPTPYLDPQHPYYASKLAAAVTAWQAVTNDRTLLSGKSPKQALSNWLKHNANRLGLILEDGNLNETAIEEIAKIANWETRGGAPKTPGNNLPTPETRAVIGLQNGTS
jgi:hypothetical protein